jgi:16S rRNA (guanine1207-N2)-methyltransferase
MSDYYAYRQIPILLRGEPATLVGKPGAWHWDGVNPGTAALIDIMEVRPDDSVLDVGCGTGLMGLAAARLATQGRVTLVDVNVAAVACARQTLAANGVANAEVRLGDGADAVEKYDLVLSHLPRGRAVVEGLIRGVVAALKPGGRFYLVAHKRAGVKSAIACAARLLGQAGVVRQKQGYHVALAVKGQAQTLPTPTESHTEITLDGVPTTLISRPGVFAWEGLDDGTAALVRAMEVRRGEAVLDLGCGAGLLALAAARRGGQVVAVDADLRAIESARRTLAANAVAGEVLISDCAQAVLARRFDVVLCNPPFHQGVGVEYDVARQMVRDAVAVLRPGGRFYLVSNAFIRYEREMRRAFERVEEVFNDRRYRVLRATCNPGNPFA